MNNLLINVLLSTILIIFIRADQFEINENGDNHIKVSKVELPVLPYDYDSLEPYLDQETLHIHHDKHHAKYVATTLSMIANTEFENKDLITILRASYNNNQGLFNNAAQSYNHAFYFNCMKPNGGGYPSENLLSLIERDFGHYDKFRDDFINAGLTAFGSGWAWLVIDADGILKVKNTIGANNPLTDENTIPLLTMDVWEHAYYLSYQNMRDSYAKTFMNHLVNWDFVENQLSHALMMR